MTGKMINLTTFAISQTISTSLHSCWICIIMTNDDPKRALWYMSTIMSQMNLMNAIFFRNKTQGPRVCKKKKKKENEIIKHFKSIQNMLKKFFFTMAWNKLYQKHMQFHIIYNHKFVISWISSQTVIYDTCQRKVWNSS